MKINYKKYLCSCFIASICFSFTVPINAENIAITSEYSDFDSDISMYANDIQWRYKTVNGVAYKRKFNYSTDEWIGPWIKC